MNDNYPPGITEHDIDGQTGEEENWDDVEDEEDEETFDDEFDSTMNARRNFIY